MPEEKKTINRPIEVDILERIISRVSNNGGSQAIDDTTVKEPTNAKKDGYVPIPLTPDVKIKE